MTDSDDMGGRIKDVGAAGAGLGRRPTDVVRAAGTQAYQRASAVMGRGYAEARGMAGEMPDALSAQIARAPLTSVMVAALVGIGIGWTLRGSIDD